MDPTNLIAAAVVSVCVSCGVSLGDWNDKTTWKINPARNTTQAELRDARLTVQNFDLAKFQMNAVIQKQIDGLAAQQTPDLLRQAILGKDGGRLSALDSQIETLRGQMK